MLIAARNGFLAEGILPPGARWVEYLRNTGTQWIDSGVTPSNYSDVIYDCYIGIEQYTGNRNLCGAQNINFFGFAANGAFESYHALSKYAVVGQLYHVVFHMKIVSGGSERWFQQIDNEGPFGIWTSTSGFSHQHILLGALSKLDDNNPDANYYRYFYLGAFKIVCDGQLIRNFRPIAIGTTGYMLDLVSGEYLPYGNAGTGAFIIGPDASAPAVGGGGYKRKCVRRSYRRSLRPSARFWRTPLWKEVT